jgi:glycine oxidase
VITCGHRYLVPRGLSVLVGSTIEDAGFAPEVTADGLASLAGFAVRAVPRLASATVDRSWAGLRPATPDGRPIIDEPLPGLFIAAGHERFGISMAPATGELVANMIARAPIDLELEDFRLSRFRESSRGM